MKKFRGAFIKSEQEIAIMREANRMVAGILDVLGSAVQPGMATMEFEKLAVDQCKKYKVKPAFLGYCGYPFALCCSVNEEVVHGFPSERKLSEGDIVSFDMGVIYNGFYGDAARTFAVGKVSDDAQRLMRVTEASLMAGIAAVIPGNDVYSIGAAVQKVAEAEGFGVVRRFVGHGIGAKLHEKPEIPNFKPAMQGMPMQEGMVLAIEPMITLGSYEVEILSDNWTAVTKDRSLAAHFEHSVAVTKNGPEILSVSGRGPNLP